MIASRNGRDILGFDYDRFVMAMDWNRVCIEAQGEHIRADHTPEHVICGQCLRSVLLRESDW